MYVSCIYKRRSGFTCANCLGFSAIMKPASSIRCVAVCCVVFHGVACCCSIWKCLVACCKVVQCVVVSGSAMQCDAVWQCDAV